MIGQTISHYRILEEIGAGGMGIVYRGQDTRLGREVAIKLLPEAFATDPERLARFEREARLLASLNHPHIAAIYGLEESDGVRGLVMEFVPGATLAERLAAGPLKLGEALDLCRQIAEALEAAHDKGIVHRDLKPANIKVTPDGQVKVLDFGLAKAFRGESAGTDVSESATVTIGPTQAGAILGTAAYMSPQQAQGKPLDKRTDIWSFGCVMYEALTGRRAFGGETVADSLPRILEHEPDWEALPGAMPRRIRELLRRCLRKDPGSRLHDIADARIEIEEALATPAEEPRVAPRRWQKVLPWGLAGLMAVIAGGFGAWNLVRPSPPRVQPVARAVIPLPFDAPVAVGSPRPAVALSPDGARLVYVANRAGRTQLYLRHMDGPDATPMAGTEGASGPFWSPDGQWVGFFATNAKLKKVSPQGGAPVSLADMTPVTRGASWGPDDTIIFTNDPNSGLFRLSGAGSGEANRVVSADRFPGERRTELWFPWFLRGQVTSLDSQRGERSHCWPEILPGGKAVLFTLDTGGGSDDARIAALSLQTKEEKVLVEGGSNPRYSPTGHVVFARAGSLLAAPFDIERLEVIGAPVLVVEGVWTEITGAAHFSLSSNGTLVYVAGGAAAPGEAVVWVDRNGNTQPLIESRSGCSNPAVSPDGRRLALSIADGSNSDIWVMDLARRTPTRLTFHPEEDLSPVWAPDGKRLAFASEMGGQGPVLYWMPADASAPPEQLIKPAEYWQFPSSWSPDGRLLAYTEHLHPPRNGMDIWVLPLEGERKPRLFLGTEFDESQAMFSPDGRWIAYVSNESGQDEVYVRPYPGPGAKWKISTQGGSEPDWTRNGRELVYRNGDKMMAVAIHPGPQFDVAEPRLLFEGRFEQIWPPGRSYAVTPDGERFVMIKRNQASPPAQLQLVLGWADELKRRAPGRTSR